MSLKVEMDFTKTARENAELYYGLVKKYKKKLAGLAKGEKELERKLNSAERSRAIQKKLVVKRERKWFEKFHWFITSEGFLVIAGRDAKSNEQLVKKHMEDEDIYFHADIHGAPHTLLKTGGKKPGQKSKAEAASFAASFSKAWAYQLPSVDVYSAKPSQVTKAAPSGESIGTGAFMVYGEREWFRKTPLEMAVGLKKEVPGKSSNTSFIVFSGPSSAVAANSEFRVKIGFGHLTKGETAKKIVGRFTQFAGKEAAPSLDDIVAVLPSGGAQLL